MSCFKKHNFVTSVQLMLLPSDIKVAFIVMWKCEENEEKLRGNCLYHATHNVMVHAYFTQNSYDQCLPFRTEVRGAEVESTEESLSLFSCCQGTFPFSLGIC